MFFHEIARIGTLYAKLTEALALKDNLQTTRFFVAGGEQKDQCIWISKLWPGFDSKLRAGQCFLLDTLHIEVDQLEDLWDLHELCHGNGNYNFHEITGRNILQLGIVQNNIKHENGKFVLPVFNWNRSVMMNMFNATYFKLTATRKFTFHVTFYEWDQSMSVDHIFGSPWTFTFPCFTFRHDPKKFWNGSNALRSIFISRHDFQPEPNLELEFSLEDGDEKLIVTPTKPYDLRYGGIYIEERKSNGFTCYEVMFQRNTQFNMSSNIVDDFHADRLILWEFIKELKIYPATNSYITLGIQYNCFVIRSTTGLAYF